jgi:hypothetical protein
MDSCSCALSKGTAQLIVALHSVCHRAIIKVPNSMSVILWHFAVLMCKVTEIYYTESWKGILSLEMVKLESSPFFSYCCISHQASVTQAQRSLHYQMLWVPTFWWTKWSYNCRVKHNHSGELWKVWMHVTLVRLYTASTSASLCMTCHSCPTCQCMKHTRW